MKDLARAAAEWWGQKLSGTPSGYDQFRRAGYLRPEAGEKTNEVGIFGGYLVSKILDRGPAPAPEQVDLFVSRLAALLEAKVEHRDPTWALPVTTDYHPDATLREALEGTGIKDADLRLPWKTRMWFCREYLEAGGDLLWQTKRDAVRRAAEVKIKSWEDLVRDTPRWRAFGDSGPGKWDGDGGPRDDAAVEAYWLDSDVVGKFARERIAELPEHPPGDVEATAASIVEAAALRAPSVLKLRKGMTFLDGAGRWEVEVLGILTREQIDEWPQWRGTYGNVVVSRLKADPERVACVDLLRFCEWWVETGARMQLAAAG